MAEGGVIDMETDPQDEYQVEDIEDTPKVYYGADPFQPILGIDFLTFVRNQQGHPMNVRLFQCNSLAIVTVLTWPGFISFLRCQNPEISGAQVALAGATEVW